MDQLYIGGFSTSTLKREVCTPKVSDVCSFVLVLAFFMVSVKIFETHVIHIGKLLRGTSGILFRILGRLSAPDPRLKVEKSDFDFFLNLFITNFTST